MTMSLPFRLFFGSIFALIVVGTGYAAYLHKHSADHRAAWCALSGYETFTISHHTLCVDPKTRQMFRPPNS